MQQSKSQCHNFPSWSVVQHCLFVLSEKELRCHHSSELKTVVIQGCAWIFTWSWSLKVSVYLRVESTVSMMGRIWIVLWLMWIYLFYFVSQSRMQHKLLWFYSLVIWMKSFMFVGGSRCGFPAFWTQFSGSGCDYSLCYTSRAITAVCITHHLLPENHSSPGTKIHSSSRMHSGNTDLILGINW